MAASLGFVAGPLRAALGRSCLSSRASRAALLPLTSGATGARVARAHGASAAAPRGLPMPAAAPGGGSGGLMGGGAGGGAGRRSVRVASGGSGGPGGDSGSSGLWASYLQLLETQPMLTRCITCALLNGLGDAFCQLVIEEHAIDWKRFTTFTLLGLLFVGPILTTWYSNLGRIVTAPGTQGVVISLVLDQFAFAPVFIASFMSVMQLIEGKPERIQAKLKQDLPDALKVNWLMWIPAQAVNFFFVPPHLRVLAVNVVALAWNSYLSFQSNKVVAAPAPPAPAVPEPKGKAGKKK